MSIIASLIVWKDNAEEALCEEDAIVTLNDDSGKGEGVEMAIPIPDLKLTVFLTFDAQDLIREIVKAIRASGE